jgi:hypothetical protein
MRPEFERFLNSDGFGYGITVGASKETTVLNAGRTLAVTGSARQILKTLGAPPPLEERTQPPNPAWPDVVQIASFNRQTKS